MLKLFKKDIRGSGSYLTFRHGIKMRKVTEAEMALPTYQEAKQKAIFEEFTIDLQGQRAISLSHGTYEDGTMYRKMAFAIDSQLYILCQTVKPDGLLEHLKFTIHEADETRQVAPFDSGMLYKALGKKCQRDEVNNLIDKIKHLDAVIECSFTVDDAVEAVLKAKEEHERENTNKSST